MLCFRVYLLVDSSLSQFFAVVWTSSDFCILCAEDTYLSLSSSPSSCVCCRHLVTVLLRADIWLRRSSSSLLFSVLRTSSDFVCCVLRTHCRHHHRPVCVADILWLFYFVPTSDFAVRRSSSSPLFTVLCTSSDFVFWVLRTTEFVVIAIVLCVADI